MAATAPYDSNAWSIANKVCIVTGSNSGIGRVTATELAKRGAAKVILACRNVQAAEEVAKDIRQQAGFSEAEGTQKVVVRKLDLGSLQSVRQFAAEINEKEPVLNVLVNNAGLEAPNERQITVDGYELTFATNHLGPFLLTNLLIDLLKKSAPSRVVIVGSVMYRQAWPAGFDLSDVNQEHVRRYNGTKSYCQSKLANILFARELHRRINSGVDGDGNGVVEGAPSSGVSVFSLHPGMVRSNFLRNRSGANAVFGKIFFACTGTIDVEQGAQTSLFCACQPGLERFSGKYFSSCKVDNPWAIARDDVKAKNLWQLSEQLIEAASNKK